MDVYIEYPWGIATLLVTTSNCSVAGWKSYKAVFHLEGGWPWDFPPPSPSFPPPESWTLYILYISFPYLALLSFNASKPLN